MLLLHSSPQDHGFLLQSAWIYGVCGLSVISVSIYDTYGRLYGPRSLLASYSRHSLFPTLPAFCIFIFASNIYHIP